MTEQDFRQLAAGFGHPVSEKAAYVAVVGAKGPYGLKNVVAWDHGRIHVQANSNSTRLKLLVERYDGAVLAHHPYVVEVPPGRALQATVEQMRLASDPHWYDKVA